MKTFGKLFLLLPLLVLGLGSTAIAQEAPKQKVVYHVSEADKVPFALGNIRNHIEGMGGPENVEIVLVAHGSALQAFHDISALDRVRQLTDNLGNDGVEFEACGNTMRAQNVELEDLVGNFVRVDQGGVVRIAQLQQQGYLYIRP